MRTPVLLSFALPVPCLPSEAQSSAPAPRAVRGQPRHAALDLATGELTTDDQDRGVGLVTVWANTDYSGHYGTPSVAGEEWLDWGSISTTSGSDIVGAFEFGYHGLSSSTDLCLNFYDGEVLVDFTDPFGELLGLPTALGNPSVFQLPVPFNLHLAGFDFHVQAAGLGGGITLHCAYACTLGF